MRMNNETIWEQAEVLAKSINEAYQNSKKSDMHIKGESLVHAIGCIEMSVEKSRFVGICNVIAKYMPMMSDGFIGAVAFANSLPKLNKEDRDVTFGMFITCVKFHLAIYKRDWADEDK